MNTKPLKPTDKRLVTDQVGTHPITYSLEHHTLDKVIKDLQRIKADYPDHLNLRFDYGYCYKYDEHRYYYLIYDRPETDEEVAKRLALDEEREARERELFSRLKKKYDDTTT